MRVNLIGRSFGRRADPGWTILFSMLVMGALSARGKDFVRKVDLSLAPEMKELAGRARQLGNEMYPKALGLLTDEPGKLPRQFDIVFKQRLSSREFRGTGTLPGCVGGWRGTTIYLDAQWFALNPTNFDSIFIHEMAHVAQQYPRKAPSHWQEGIADYVSAKLLCTNESHCAECSNISPHYRSGYSCAAAFLLYVEQTHNSNVVRQLQSALRRGSYNDAFFTKATGRTLDQLWDEFKTTPAYKPSADEAIKFYKSLGYTNGATLKQLRARFKQQPGGALTLEAQEFLSGLGFKRQLPGFRKGESGPSTIRVVMPKETKPDVYPVSRTFDSSIEGKETVYHYVVVRASRHSAWKLQRAWRTDPEGRLIEEFAIP